MNSAVNMWLAVAAMLACASKTLQLQGKKGDDGRGTDLDTSNPHRDPSMCEVCKFLTEELKLRLSETGKTKEVLETGHGLDTKKKRKPYVKSILSGYIRNDVGREFHTCRAKELRLIEALTDPHVCDKILEYNIHAERKGSLRFAKGRSETMQTLHNLQNKGVKVDLGIPDEMWDTPSASVTEMQRKCFKIVELYEEDIEEWYFGDQVTDLTGYLCHGRVLTADDTECLEEVWTGKEKIEAALDEEKKNKGKSKKQKNKNEKDDDSDDDSDDDDDKSDKDEL